MQIIAVASGKGGVGKSLVSANLAIALTRMKKQVILADLDLGGSNLHLVLGEHVGTRGLGTFLNNSQIGLNQILYPTSWKGLSFIPGEAELPGAANVNVSSISVRVPASIRWISSSSQAAEYWWRHRL